MRHTGILVFGLAVALSCHGVATGPVEAGVIPQTTAARHGLDRAWFTQVQLDRSRSRVAHVVLIGGTLFVQTDEAMLHAIDAETGQSLWVVRVGQRGHLSLQPGANENVVATVNGSHLYILNRATGKLLWTTKLEGAPGAGPVCSANRVYVPMTRGLLVSFRMEPVKNPLAEFGIANQQQEVTAEEQAEADTKRRGSFRIVEQHEPPLLCQSHGRTLIQPIVTAQSEADEYLAWPTDQGFLFVGRVHHSEKRFTLEYQLKTRSEIASRPTYLPPNPQILGDSGIIFASSRDGFVHAIRERSGTSLWRFSSADPIVEPAVVVGSNVYVVTQLGSMYCLDAKTGMEKWSTYQIDQFIAASNDRVYAADKRDHLVSLRADTGARLDRIFLDDADIRLINPTTDRIYLVSVTGQVQCLHEVELTEPIRHDKLPEAAAEPPVQADDEEGAQPDAPAQKAPAGNNPFD